MAFSRSRQDRRPLVVETKLQTKEDRTLAFHDAVVSACFAGGKNIERKKNGVVITGGDKKPEYVLHLWMSEILKDSSTFFYEPLTGFVLEDYATMKPYDFSQALRVAKHMCKAVAFIHELGICHRNLTPDAFVVVLQNEYKKTKTTTKLWKFGNSCAVKKWGLGECISPPKSPYSAPETLTNEKSMSRLDWIYADRYSLGACLEYLLTFGGEEKLRVKEIHSFITLMKQQRARRRPSPLKAIDFFEQL
ncbi:serine/threonine protein kinase [Tokyovirus A1]|uniref:serine/threonine protein kinase n=1 Tax=Tokyovirus A1 TaxID=1826170 RepID=UPI0007A98347|nr:serine/threonine protein kinase [Tokyovirus A1]BAU79956.1 serine/threonine protein kinase [Tokyovirus A1]